MKDELNLQHFPCKIFRFTLNDVTLSLIGHIILLIFSNVGVTVYNFKCHW